MTGSAARPLKKILIAYSAKPPIMEYLTRAFAAKGVEAVSFFADRNHWFDRGVINHVNKIAHNLRIIPKDISYFSGHPLAHLNYRTERLRRAVAEHSPDLVFIIRGIAFRDGEMRDIRKNSMLFGWWIEREERMEEAMRESALYDHMFFMNTSCVEEGAKRGFTNLSVLHHAVDTSVFHPIACERRFDWCFVGSWSPKRQGYIERAAAISKNGVIYGPRWIKNNLLNSRIRGLVKGSYIEGPELTKLYGETKVVVNVTNWGFGPGAKRTGMNMRVLEVPACGAFLLTDASRDLTDVATPGAHLAVYDEDPGDFTAKFRKYLSDDAARERIARDGSAHVSKCCTYSAMAAAIIGQYEKLRGARG